MKKNAPKSTSLKRCYGKIGSFRNDYYYHKLFLQLFSTFAGSS